jgi:hypothetical protein
MGKKCVPGLFCVENMTLFLVVVIGIMVVYLYYVCILKQPRHTPAQYPSNSMPTIIVANTSPPSISDPYNPPYKQDLIVRPQVDLRQPLDLRPQIDVRTPMSIPVNIKTNSANLPYTQVGILTKNDKGTMILPLMGRNLWNGRDKWQYYTMSNTAGALNTKLPISVNGRSCTGEYGCDSISNGDTVYVEGYNDTFRATIYENSVLQYLPV